MILIMLFGLFVLFPSVIALNGFVMYWAMVGLVVWQEGDQKGWKPSAALCCIADFVLWMIAFNVVAATVLALSGTLIANGFYARRLAKQSAQPDDVREVFK